MPLNTLLKRMKDRIRQIMESKGMTQQVFAQFIELSPASLSSIFNDRTKPTLNIVEAIKKKIPDINTNWLLFGSGQMYDTPSTVAPTPQSPTPPPSGGHEEQQDLVLDFDQPSSPAPEFPSQQLQNFNSVKNTRQNIAREEVKISDKPKRRVTEIRVYYDDHTWESFTPSSK